MTNTDFLFVLGNSPELAEEELASVLPDKAINSETFNLLGGTIKVAKLSDLTPLDLLSEGKKANERIIFGLSGEVNTTETKKLKQQLEARGFKVRFVLPQKGENELSSVVVAKQKVEEIYLIGDLLAKTVWVQDWQNWGKRDYERPQVQGHIGMLPPKVARMMVNIGLSSTDNQLQKPTILDPFCGVGTILAEALIVGAKVVGSDIDNRQVERSKKNLEWLTREYSLPAIDYRLLQADARNISSRTEEKVDAIVTEPDLGPNTTMNYELRIKNYGNLEKLYLDSLNNWKKLLKWTARVVMVIPSFVISDNLTPIRVNTDLLEEVIDKAKIMGYSLVSEPFPYYRPQAIVRRNICVFRLEGQ